MTEEAHGSGDERSLDELVQTVSERAVELARQEIELARAELTAKARQAAPGAAMVGGAAVLGALASGTGTAALVLLLAGRARPSAAALAVTGLYGGAGAVLARQGVERLRAAGPPIPEATVESVKEDFGWMKRRVRSART
jgi:Putative Actinobacterial Holin-X, holin superfamily III